MSETIEPILPDKVSHMGEVLDLHRWLEKNRQNREKIDARQHRRLKLLVAEAHDVLHAIDRDLELCHLGAYMRSGMDVDSF